jgi:hypothetical protein
MSIKSPTDSADATKLIWSSPEAATDAPFTTKIPSILSPSALSMI